MPCHCIPLHSVTQRAVVLLRHWYGMLRTRMATTAVWRVVLGSQSYREVAVGGGEKAYILLKLFVSRAIVLDYLRWDIARARIFRFMVLGRIFFGCAKITISVWWHVMGFSDNWMALVSNSVVLVVHVGSNTIAASNSNFMDEYLNIQIDWWSFWEFQRRRLWMFNEIIQQLC